MAVANFKDAFYCNGFAITLAFSRGLFTVSETTPVSVWECTVEMIAKKIKSRNLDIKRNLKNKKL
jgi:hypothetical protein